MKKFLIISSILCGVLFAAESLDDANKAFNSGKYEQAIEIYKKLCDAKEAKACSSLGLMYRNAKGVKEDANLAKEYYKKACDAGDKESCSSVGW